MSKVEQTPGRGQDILVQSAGTVIKAIGKERELPKLFRRVRPLTELLTHRNPKATWLWG